MYGRWLGGDEGVGGWSWGEVGCCTGEQGGDWVEHFFFLGGKSVGGFSGVSCFGILFWDVSLDDEGAVW